MRSMTVSWPTTRAATASWSARLAREARARSSASLEEGSATAAGSFAGLEAWGGAVTSIVSSHDYAARVKGGLECARRCGGTGVRVEVFES